MLTPPKEYCNQSVVFKRKKAPDPNDVYDEPVFEDGVKIDHCVVHLRTVYSGTNNNREIVANGTVVLFAGISSPLISLTKDDLGSKIVYEGKEYTLTNINEDLDPLSNELYQYKLQIL